VGSNQDGRTSNLNEGNLLYTNLVLLAAQSLAAGDKVQYRLPMEQKSLAVFNLIVTQGTAHIYGWNPRHSFFPDYYTDAQNMGDIQVETLAFYAPETGVYVIEIQATEDAVYQLVSATPGSMTGLSDQALNILQISAETPAGAVQQVLEKGQAQALIGLQTPTTSLPLTDTFSTPWQDIPVDSLPPAAYPQFYLFLPWVAR
jgi:hypothetical protein